VQNNAQNFKTLHPRRDKPDKEAGAEQSAETQNRILQTPPFASKNAM